MSDICWHCGKPIRVFNGEPSFETYADPLGHEHKLHKPCFRFGGYTKKPLSATPKDGDLIDRDMLK
ncbi:MAG: hypothetical protein H3C26_16005 [Rhodocyclaceae bacterium]|nr:hypothetical protein [Rhodocyclaceae bacterium]